MPRVISVFYPHLQPYGVGVLVCAIYGEENRGTEKVKHLSKVTSSEITEENPGSSPLDFRIHADCLPDKGTKYSEFTDSLGQE